MSRPLSGNAHNLYSLGHGRTMILAGAAANTLNRTDFRQLHAAEIFHRNGMNRTMNRTVTAHYPFRRYQAMAYFVTGHAHDSLLFLQQRQVGNCPGRANAAALMTGIRTIAAGVVSQRLHSTIRSVRQDSGLQYPLGTAADAKLAGCTLLQEPFHAASSRW